MGSITYVIHIIYGNSRPACRRFNNPSVRMTHPQLFNMRMSRILYVKGMLVISTYNDEHLLP
jgi:hypothetical protein